MLTPMSTMPDKTRDDATRHGFDPLINTPGTSGGDKGRDGLYSTHYTTGTSCSLSGEAAIKQDIIACAARTKAMITIPIYDPNGNDLFSVFQDRVRAEFHGVQLLYVLNVSKTDCIEPEKRDAALDYAAHTSGITMSGGISIYAQDQATVFKALSNSCGTEVKLIAKDLITEVECGTRLWEVVCKIAYRRGTQRRRELHSKIQAVASAPLRAPFIKMRITLDQLICKHNCFSDVECDLWLVAHIVMTSALGTSPHAEWRSWIQVKGSDFEARHRANPAAFGWKELCECIETREHTLYLTYGKPRGSTPEAHFLKTAKMGNEGSRTKQHCKYHDKEVAHTEDECLLNPANKAKKQEFEKKKKADADKRKANAEKKRATANVNKNDKNGKPSHDLKDIVCWTCGEKGHLATSCPKKKDTKKDESASFAYALSALGTPSDP